MGGEHAGKRHYGDVYVASLKLDTGNWKLDSRQSAVGNRKLAGGG